MAAWIKEQLIAMGRDESGASMIEYVMIASGVSILILAIVTTMGGSLMTMMTSAADGL